LVLRLASTPAPGVNDGRSALGLLSRVTNMSTETARVLGRRVLPW